jgi:hypothetical protein
VTAPQYFCSCLSKKKTAKHAQKWLLKELGKNGYQNSSVSDVRKEEQK